MLCSECADFFLDMLEEPPLPAPLGYIGSVVKEKPVWVVRVEEDAPSNLIGRPVKMISCETPWTLNQ